ncbi:hypothetical protein CH63R_07800 [Colletotrichum higginsianum IMI 349063]|uniref:Uncharacterized protein n=1 Tax=Colletotrichum higginsianum (strain IMI 349063) TaxID=759273 RepID=A0A1B7YAP7_COLHI|nr:hypothetical protein CH63R_07800 [Colletotrichum higginsianum IMI 349063]OBR09035.1 hypothetical protein CH63R_07800 [Colletotrichum higginsianum IMI 349063]
MESNISMAQVSNIVGPERGQSFKDFYLSVTNDLDWGSPEPEDIEKRIEWREVAHSGQWIILSVLCQYKTFASAIRTLQMTTPDVINFVTLYIKFHRATKLWAKKIDETSVSDLLRKSGEHWPGVDEMDDYTRPRLPTDVLENPDREEAIKYLRQVGQEEAVEDIDEWRGLSTDFHTLPIEPEIMARVVVILDEEEGFLGADNTHSLPDGHHLSWIGSGPSVCQDLAKCLGELQVYLTRPSPSTASTCGRWPTGSPKGSQSQRRRQNAPGNNVDCSTEEINQLFPQRVPSVDMRGYPGFESIRGREDASVPKQDSNQPQPLSVELQVPLIRIREATPQAQPDHSTGGQLSMNKLLSSVQPLHPSVRLPGPNLGRDTYSFPHGKPDEELGHGHTPHFFQDRDKIENQLNKSTRPNFPGPTPMREQRFQVIDFETLKGQIHKETQKENLRLPVAPKHSTGKASVLSAPRNAFASPILTDDDLESPTMPSSKQASRKRKVDDSDGEYRPRTERPRKEKARKSAPRNKNTTSPQTIQPQQTHQPQLTIQPQMGAEGILQPVKRGRGRPRKYPKPEVPVIRAAPGQSAAPHSSANDAGTQQVAAPPGTTIADNSASARGSGGDTNAGGQTHVGGRLGVLNEAPRSTSDYISPYSRPQSFPQVALSSNASHATVAHSNTPQAQIEADRDGLLRRQPNNYEEFWTVHQNLANAARPGYWSYNPSPDDNGTLSYLSSSQPASRQNMTIPTTRQSYYDQGLGTRPVGQQTSQGANVSAPSTQQQPQNNTDYFLHSAHLNRCQGPSALNAIAQQARDERIRSEAAEKRKQGEDVNDTAQGKNK